jgi:hypothetical protein
VSSPTRPTKQRRRSRRGCEISDDEIARLLQQHPTSALDKADHDRLAELRAGDRFNVERSFSGTPDQTRTELLQHLAAWSDHAQRCVERERAVAIEKQITEVAALLRARHVAEPKPRAAQYFAARWRPIMLREGNKRLSSGRALLQWLRRVLNAPH